MDKQVERDLRELFTISTRTPLEEMAWGCERTRIQPGRMGYRTRTVKAGAMLEIDCYPLLGRAMEQEARQHLRNRTPLEIQRANDRRAERRLVQLINANFGRGDYHITLTYHGGAPDYATCKHDVQLYLARVNRARARIGLPKAGYVYAVEDVQDGREVRTHAHLIIHGGMPREELERIWGKGYANTYALEPSERGLEGMAKYLIKAQRGRKKWIPSKGLKKPQERVSDVKLSNARVRQIAMDAENMARAVLERAYPGHLLVDCRVRWSDRVDGCYISALMRDTRRDSHGAKGRAGAVQGRGAGDACHQAAAGQADAVRSAARRGESTHHRHAAGNQ